MNRYHHALSRGCLRLSLERAQNVVGYSVPSFTPIFYTFGDSHGPRRGFHDGSIARTPDAASV